MFVVFIPIIVGNTMNKDTVRQRKTFHRVRINYKIAESQIARKQHNWLKGFPFPKSDL